MPKAISDPVVNARGHLADCKARIRDLEERLRRHPNDRRFKRDLAAEQQKLPRLEAQLKRVIREKGQA